MCFWFQLKSFMMIYQGYCVKACLARQESIQHMKAAGIADTIIASA